MGDNTSVIAVTIIENILHNCKYKDDGCQATSSWAKLDQHHDQCPYRSVPCPYHTKHSTPLNGLVKHCTQEHGSKFNQVPVQIGGFVKIGNGG